MGEKETAATAASDPIAMAAKQAPEKKDKDAYVQDNSPNVEMRKTRHDAAMAAIQNIR